MRNFVIALFATAALPAIASALPPAAAQDENTADRGRFERRFERSAQRDNDSAPRQRPEFRREPVAQSAPAAEVRVNANARAERSWTGASAGSRAGSVRSDRAGFDGNRNRRFDTPTAPVERPPAIEQQAQRSNADNGRRDFNRDANRRGFDANNARRDYNRDNNANRDFNRDNRNSFDANANNARRDFDRNENNRRDWNNRNGNRDNRGWNGNRNAGNHARNWDRNWRSNQRYDWQRYRGSNRNAFRLPRYSVPYGWNYGYRRFSVGAYLFAGLFSQNYWIGNPWDYRLPPVEWPYQWVRYYDDALLVDTRSGYVVDSIQDIFWY